MAQRPDPRVGRTTRHLLLEIVVIAVWAVIGGAETWGEMAEYGRAKDAWCKRVLPRPPGLPSHDTCARVLARRRPEAFRRGFLAWRPAVQERLGGPGASPLVALDGKAARHGFDRAVDRGPLHRVSAWAPAAHVVLGQVAVEQKSNEMTAIPT